MTVEEFIEDRIAEDEAVASKSAGFRYGDPSDAPWVVMRERVAQGVAMTSDAHFARHDPARVLRQVQFARGLLTLAEAAKEAHEADMQNGTGDGGMYEYRMGQWHVYPILLRSLAAIWSDHPDYDPSWAVGEGGSKA